MKAVLLALLLVLSLALAAFCAGVETGFLSLSRGRVLHLAASGSRAARILQRALGELPRTLTALLVGNNLAGVAYSSASAALAEIAFPGSAAARAGWSFCAATAILYLGEFLPKLACSSRPLRRMLAAARLWRAFAAAFAPLTACAMAVTGLFMRREPERRERVTAEEILRILRDRKDGVRLTDLESALIARILVLRAKGAPVTPESLLSALAG